MCLRSVALFSLRSHHKQLEQNLKFRWLRELSGRIHKLQKFQFKVVALCGCDNWQVGYLFSSVGLSSSGFLFLLLCWLASCFWLKDTDCVSVSSYPQSTNISKGLSKILGYVILGRWIIRIQQIFPGLLYLHITNSWFHLLTNVTIFSVSNCCIATIVTI